MSWSALATGIRALYTADTGSGGLNETSGSLKLTGWFTEDVSLEQAPPYVVVSLVGDVEDHVGDGASQLTEFEFDVDIYVNKERGLVAAQAYRDRVRTILHRVTPTVAGFTAHDLFRQDGFIDTSGQRIRFVETYTGSIAKGA